MLNGDDSECLCNTVNRLIKSEPIAKIAVLGPLVLT
jgi:hypothetical protein